MRRSCLYNISSSVSSKIYLTDLWYLVISAWNVVGSWCLKYLIRQSFSCGIPIFVALDQELRGCPLRQWIRDLAHPQFESLSNGVLIQICGVMASFEYNPLFAKSRKILINGFDACTSIGILEHIVSCKSKQWCRINLELLWEIEFDIAPCNFKFHRVCNNIDFIVSWLLDDTIANCVFDSCIQYWIWLVSCCV